MCQWQLKFIALMFPISGLIAACSEEPSKSDASLTMPLYAECLDRIAEFSEFYRNKFSGTEVKLSIKSHYYDVTSAAHREIIGTIEISGSNLPLEIELYSSAIQWSCYPMLSQSFQSGVEGVSELRKSITANNNMGIEKHYLRWSSKEIQVYFNDGKNRHPK